MKRVLVMLLTIMLLIGLNLNTYKCVKGEVVENEELTEEVVEQVTEETNEEEIHEPTKLNTWFSDNLGWIFGVPVGTIITILIEMIYLFKKGKAKAEELKETKDVKQFAIDELKIANKLIEDTKEMQIAVQKVVDYVKNNSEKTYTLIEQMLTGVGEIVGNVKEDFTNQFINNQSQLEKNFVELERMLKRFCSIENTQKLIALNTKELVCTGTAEKIVKLLEGADNEEI